MTERQEQIYAAIDEFAFTRGYAPTVREIGDIVGLDSSSTIHAHLTAMRIAGHVDWVDGQARTLHIPSRLVSEIEARGEVAA